jgi:DNA recombination protein RmuC
MTHPFGTLGAVSSADVLLIVLAVIGLAVLGAVITLIGRQRTPLDTAILTEAVRATVATEMLHATQAAFDQQGQRAREAFDARVALADRELRELRQVVDQLRASVDHDRGALSRMAESISSELARLTTSTQALDGALRSSTARGSWGELQLRNVIELAGMTPYSDYLEQTTVGGAGGSTAVQRPDVLVRLPHGAFIAIDAKAPMAAYLRAQDTDDPAQRQIEVAAHVRALRDHVRALAARRYWEQFPNAPDFVVLFVPGESVLAEALRADPALLDDAMRDRVLVASPVNLLALLLAVARGWQAFRIAEHADRVAALGKELYDRVGKVLGSMSTMGRGLDQATRAYNEMVASMETRMLVSLRRFRDLGVTSEDLPEVHRLKEARREVVAGELSQPDPG